MRPGARTHPVRHCAPARRRGVLSLPPSAARRDTPRLRALETSEARLSRRDHGANASASLPRASAKNGLHAVTSTGSHQPKASTEMNVPVTNHDRHNPSSAFVLRGLRQSCRPPASWMAAAAGFDAEQRLISSMTDGGSMDSPLLAPRGPERQPGDLVHSYARHQDFARSQYLLSSISVWR